jgi:hypothetical protein
MANPEASVAQILSSCVRSWFDKKLVFIKWFGGPIIDKTDMSVADDRINQLSNSEKLSTKKMRPFSDLVLIVRWVPHSLSCTTASSSMRMALDVMTMMTTGL